MSTVFNMLTGRWEESMQAELQHEANDSQNLNRELCQLQLLENEQTVSRPSSTHLIDIDRLLGL